MLAFTRRHRRPAILTLIFSTACGGSSGGGTPGATEGSLAGKKYVVVEAGDATRTAQTIAGSGSVVFKDPIGELAAKKDYALGFRLDDGGSLKLIAHADEKLAGGVSVLLKRSGSTLTAQLAGADGTAEAKELAGMQASGDIVLNADVHNDENPTHILLWNGAGDDFSEEAALLNSEEDGATPGQGAGTFWGLVLSQATVTKAEIADPKFVEE